MIISETIANQEVDIIKKILTKCDGLDDVTKVNFDFPELRCKRFKMKDFPEDKFQKRIVEIATKFRKTQHINDFIFDRTSIAFNVKNKEEELKKYKEQLEYEIGKEMLKINSKKGNYCYLTDETKTLTFVLPNGQPVHVYLWTRESRNTKLYKITRVLYYHWIEFYEQKLTKEKIKNELAKLGWDNVSDYDIKNYIKNLRDTKIKPAGLHTYISIVYDRKQKGYVVSIGYP